MKMLDRIRLELQDLEREVAEAEERELAEARKARRAARSRLTEHELARLEEHALNARDLVDVAVDELRDIVLSAHDRSVLAGIRDRLSDYECDLIDRVVAMTAPRGEP